jgi:farnesyl-diphosphate farnesyltransferase
MLTIWQLFVAWLAGARFDIAYYKMKEQLGGLMGWTSSNMTKIAEVTKVVEAVPEHSEL